MAQTNERVILKRGKSSTIPQAKEAGSILIETDTGYAYIDNSSTERVQLKDPTKLPLEGGTMTGDIDMGDNNITTTHEPENDEDVANKAYVDANIHEYTGEDPIIVDEDSVISHRAYGEQSGGPTRATLEFGKSFIVPNITSNDTGHVTNIRDIELTLPDHPEEVTHAESADEATHAESADKATESEHANSADEADKLSEPQTIDGVEFDGTAGITHYCVCNTDGDDQGKTVDCTGFVLDEGANIEIKFTNTNTVANPTLDVNGLGTKRIYYNGRTLTTDTANYLLGGHIYRFVYDGSVYNIVGDINTDTDTNTTYTATSPILISDDNNISHLEYTPRSGGPEENTQLASGSTFTVPYIESDETGHVSTIMDRTLTLPVIEGGGGGSGDYTAEYPIEISENDVITHSNYDSVDVGPEEDKNLDFGDSFEVPHIISDGFGHVAIGETKTFTLPDSSGGGGEAGTADRLTTPRDIDGVAFDGSEDIVHYATCDTPGEDTAKTVDFEGYSADEGASIHVKFVETNTAENATLNVNDTGEALITFQAKPVKPNSIVAGTIYTFVYESGRYEIVSGSLNRYDDVEDSTLAFRNIVIIDSDDDVNEVDAPVGSVILKKQPQGVCNLYWGTCTTSGSESEKMISCNGFVLSDGATIHIKFTNTNTASSPVLNIDSTGDFPVYSQGEQITSDTFVANVVYTLVYNNGQYDLVGGATSELVDLIYPVGSIYTSTNSVSPETLFGGTWEQIQDEFLLASGSTYSSGATGGEATVTLTSSQMPSHTHSTPSHTHSIPALSGTAASAGSHTHQMQYFQNYTKNGDDQSMFFLNGDHTTAAMESAGSHTHSVTTTASTTGSSSGTSGSTGSGGSHNNMPPYLVVNVWKRTA